MNKGLSSRKSKRVKWVPDDKFCQVKLFLSEDCPSQISSKAEDHLQAKSSWMLHSNGMGFDDPPPGFDSKGNSGTSNRICIPHIKWKCPPMFMLNNDWLVVAGEFSEECETQKHREVRVLEAVYPRVSAIPPSPSVSPGTEECDCDDHETPVIPVNPIEEEDAIDHQVPPCPVPVCSESAAMNQDLMAVRSTGCNTPVESKALVNEETPKISTGLGADVVAAASAAFTAIMKSNEKGSLIDTDLLIKILSDPKMIEKLSKDSCSSTTKKLTQIYQPNPVPLPTEECPSSVFRKPLDEDSNVHKSTQPIILPVLDAFLTSQAMSNAEPCTITSKLEEINQLLRAFLSTPVTSLSLGSKMEIPSTLSASVPDRVNQKELEVEEFELQKRVPPTSGSLFPLELLAQPNRYNNNNTTTQYASCNTLPDRYSPQNLVHLDLESSRVPLKTTRLNQEPSTGLSPDPEEFRSQRPMMVPSRQENQRLTAEIQSTRKSSHVPLKTTRLNQEPSMGLSLKPEEFRSHGPNMVLSRQENERPTSEIHSTRKSSQSPSPSPRPDRLAVSSLSAIKTPVVKDTNYYKSLIKLHGMERQETQEEYTPKYKSSVFELTAVSQREDSRAKKPTLCKYFNSSKGCKRGSSCHFQHDPLLKLQDESTVDARSRKRNRLNKQ